MGSSPKDGSHQKTELIGMSMSAMNVEPPSPLVPVVVPNLDAEIAILCKHPYKLNREVGFVFKGWWHANSNKLPQEELNQMRAVLRHGILMPGRNPIIYHHPVMDLNTYEDCWAGCYIFLSCTYAPAVVMTSVIGKRCKARFQNVPWIPHPTPACVKIVTEWRPPPIVKKAPDQTLEIRTKPKRLFDTQDREGEMFTNQPSCKRPKLEQNTLAQQSNAEPTSHTPKAKPSPLQKPVTQANAHAQALPKSSSVSALAPTTTSTKPSKTESKLDHSDGSSSEDTDSDTNSVSTSDSDSSSVQITNVKKVPGRSRDTKPTRATPATRTQALNTASDVTSVKSGDRLEEQSLLLKAHTDELKQLWKKIRNVSQKRADDTIAKAKAIRSEMKLLRTEIRAAVTELKALKNDYRQSVESSKTRDKKLEARIDENSKALLKQVEDRVSKIRVTL